MKGESWWDDMCGWWWMGMSSSRSGSMEYVSRRCKITTYKIVGSLQVIQGDRPTWSSAVCEGFPCPRIIHTPCPPPSHLPYPSLQHTVQSPFHLLFIFTACSPLHHAMTHNSATFTPNPTLAALYPVQRNLADFLGTLFTFDPHLLRHSDSHSYIHLLTHTAVCTDANYEPKIWHDEIQPLDLKMSQVRPGAPLYSVDCASTYSLLIVPAPTLRSPLWLTVDHQLGRGRYLCVDSRKTC